MERCPNCRARWDGGETCRRCGMELGLLLAAEREAEGLIASGAAQLAAGQVEAALATLAKALGLTADPLAAHLRGFARILVQQPPPPGRAAPLAVLDEPGGDVRFSSPQSGEGSGTAGYP
jgi:hypothetical protein